MNKTSALVVLLGLLPGTGVQVPSPDATPTGSIEGLVTLEAPRARRTANRYAGGTARQGTIQQVPAVVYLTGEFEGEALGVATSRVEMAQRDSSFVPGVIAIPVGGTVDFPNADPFFHNVFSYSPAQRLDLGRYPQGESKSVTFDTAGVVELFCEVHEVMRGAIVVTENAFNAVVDDDGRFRLDGVPAGEHNIVIWHPDTETVERVITVTDGGTAQIEVELKR